MICFIYIIKYMSYVHLKRQDWSLEQDVVSYSAAISASESASQWAAALSLFDQMESMESIAPNVVTYSAVMGACGKAQLATQTRTAGNAWIHQYITSHKII